MVLQELSREQLLSVVAQQAIFTEGLRKVANVALAHAGHILSNYAQDVPADKLKDWAQAQIDAYALLTYPAPVDVSN